MILNGEGKRSICQIVNTTFMKTLPLNIEHNNKRTVIVAEANCLSYNNKGSKKLAPLHGFSIYVNCGAAKLGILISHVQIIVTITNKNDVNNN